ncbi:hypothetical protein QTP86_015998, partial [Hemibagrus guttatus]
RGRSLCHAAGRSGFKFFLQPFHNVMPHVDLLYAKLQKKDIDSVHIKRSIQQDIQEIRKSLHSLVDQCSEGGGSELKRRRLLSPEVHERIAAEAAQTEARPQWDHRNAASLLNLRQPPAAASSVLATLEISQDARKGFQRPPLPELGPHGEKRKPEDRPLRGPVDKLMPSKPDLLLPARASKPWLAQCVLHADTAPGSLRVTVELNGSSVPALLDSGSTIILVQPSVLPKTAKLVGTIPVSGIPHREGTFGWEQKEDDRLKHCRGQVLQTALLLHLAHTHPLGRNLTHQERTLVRRGEELLQTQQQDLTELIDQFADVFSASPGLTQLIQHEIKTPPGMVVYQRLYRVPEARRQDIEEEVEQMLRGGIIEESTSPWSSPIVVVPKPGGSRCLCNDFRRQKQNSEFDSYPLPQVDDLVEQLGKARFVSTLDLTKGYWQVALAPDAKPKAAFTTSGGHWQY